MTVERWIILALVLIGFGYFFLSGGPDTKLWGDSEPGAACKMRDGRDGKIVESGVWPLRKEYCRALRRT